jgi:hypothetical protein
MDVWGISIWYVLLATVVYFAIGSVWYSPVMFVKQWRAELPTKKNGMDTNLQTAMLIGFLCTLILVFVETYFISVTGTTTVARGAFLGAKLWLGFVGTTALINSMYAGGSKKLLAIDQGYHLVGIVVAGAIIGYFAK